MHQLTRVPETAVSLVVDAVSVEPSLVWTIAVQERQSNFDPRCVGSQQAVVMNELAIEEPCHRLQPHMNISPLGKDTPLTRPVSPPLDGRIRALNAWLLR